MLIFASNVILSNNLTVLQTSILSNNLTVYGTSTLCNTNVSNLQVNSSTIINSNLKSIAKC